MTSHASKVAALLEAREKATEGRVSPVYSLKTGWKIGRIEDHTAKPLAPDDDHDVVEFACKAANTADSVKLAHEIAEAARELRAYHIEQRRLAREDFERRRRKNETMTEDEKTRRLIEDVRNITKGVSERVGHEIALREGLDALLQTYFEGSADDDHEKEASAELAALKARAEKAEKERDELRLQLQKPEHQLRLEAMVDSERVVELEGALKQARKWHDDQAEIYFEAQRQADAERDTLEDQRLGALRSKHERRAQEIHVALANTGESKAGKVVEAARKIVSGHRQIFPKHFQACSLVWTSDMKVLIAALAELDKENTK